MENKPERGVITNALLQLIEDTFHLAAADHPDVASPRSQARLLVHLINL
jgi:hypothetical protein